MAEKFIVESDFVTGVQVESGEIIYAKAVIVATGTFLGGTIHIGDKTIEAGRFGEKAATKLSKSFIELGFEIGRLKTGTPPRLDGDTIDWSKCEISLYVYNRYRGNGHGLIYLFAGNWTEEEWDVGYNYMRDFEIYWKIEDSIGSVSNSAVGFSITDITEYIGNITTETFSIAVIPKREFDGGGQIYSSEWNGTEPMFPYILPENDSYKYYLPQLIWS